MLDLGDFGHEFGLVLVVGNVVVAFGDADFAEGAVGAVGGGHEADDAGGVGLEGEQHQVVHDPNVFAVFDGDPGGCVHARILWQAEALGFLDADFEFAHAGEVLVEFLLIARAELGLHGAGVVADEVEDGPLLLLAREEQGVALAGGAGAKEPLEKEPWVALGREGRVRRGPGEVVLVGAGVAVVAVAGFADRVGGDLEGGETGEVPDLARDELVDGDAVADVGLAFAQAGAGEEGAGGARVIAAAVIASLVGGFGGLMPQPADHLQVLLAGREWFQRGAEGEVGAGGRGPPRGGDGAIGKIDKCRAERAAGGGHAELAGAGFRAQQAGREKGLHRGQCERDSEAAEKAAAADVQVLLGGAGCGRGHRVWCGGVIAGRR